MNVLRLAAVGTFALVSIMAQAQQNTNIRGTLQGFEGGVLSIRTNSGEDTKVQLPESVGVAITKPFTLADAKPGMMLGVTTVQRNGELIAIDVRPIPPAAKPGLSPYDLQPQSTMTNAALEGSVATAGAQEITLNHGTGTVKVRVLPETPMSQAAPGSRADLKPGEAIYVAARREENGNLVAVRVQMGKDGLKPTQ
jgi:hypothetical protein